MSGSTSVQPYQASVSTTTPAHAVLDELVRSSVEGTAVTERGDSYVVFQPPGRSYRPELAAALTVAVVIVVLAFTAVSVLFIVLLPLAVVPFVPMLLRHRPSCAVSALEEQGGTTQVVAHGEATPALVDALDALLSRLAAASNGAAPPPGPDALGSEIAGAMPGSPPPGTAVVLYDPASATCREVCRLLEGREVPVTTVHFLEQAPTRADLERVARLLELRDVRRMVRTEEPLYADLQLDEATQEQVMVALVHNPELLQRPIVLRDHRAVIARPAERVLQLLDG